MTNTRRAQIAVLRTLLVTIRDEVSNLAAEEQNAREGTVADESMQEAICDLDSAMECLDRATGNATD